MNTTMKKLSMCRICLTDVTPLFSILNTHLHDIYETLTKMPFVTENSSPIQVCDLCCASLENSYELRRRCLQSEELFTQLLRSNVQVNLQVIFNRHLGLEDGIQMPLNESDNVEVKQEDTEGSEEDPLKGDDHFQSSDSGDISLAVLKKDQSDVTADDAVVEQDEADLYHNVLGLHTECDIPLDIVKEESLDDADTRDASGSEDNETNDITQTEADDVLSSAPVSKKPQITTQMNYEDTSSHNLTRSDQTKDNIEEPKSETKKTFEDKPVEKNKIVETRDIIDIRLRYNEQNDSTSDYIYAQKERPKNKISTDQSVNSSSGNNLKQLICDTCQKCFRRKSDLIKHCRIHTGEKRYVCKVCKNFFRDKTNLDNHMRTHTGEKPYQCNVCKKYFSTKCYLGPHMRTHTGEKPYQCNVCKKSFNQKGALDYHMHIHTGVKAYQCNICKKCFSVKGILNRHTRGHTGEKPYECNVCKICFSEKGHLDKHTRTHTGEKPYKCDVCKKCFSQKGSLNKHTRRHTGEKPYKCNVCKKCFSEKGSLTRHTRRHTGEKPYECNVCKKCFNEKCHLDTHTRTHTGEKPYKCNVCKKCFSEKGSLTRHIRRHTGEKPYECNLCKKCFKDKRTVVRHICSYAH